MLLLALACLAVGIAASTVAPLDLKSLGNHVLVVTAHPDDAEFLVGGTIISLTRSGARVSLLIATAGDACTAGNGANATRETTAATRLAEAQAGAAVMGIDPEDVFILGVHDGHVNQDYFTVVQQVAAFARVAQPTAALVFFQQPNFNAPPGHGKCPQCWDDLGWHPDHQAVGRAAFEALTGPATWSVLHDPALRSLPTLHLEVLYEFALTAPELGAYVKLESDVVEAKVQALLQHASQYPPGSESDVADSVAWVGGQIAAAAGLAEGTVVEGFRAFL